jgi:hypothetical protein
MNPEGDSTGRARDFVIRRRGSEEDLEPTDMSLREAWHEYDLRVSYPEAIGLEADLADIMDQDRHDICERLRSDTYFVGITGAASQSVGLLRRWRVFDELNDDGPVWIQTYRWRCLIRETI